MTFIPVSPTDENGVKLPNREIQIKQTIVNTGPNSIPLAGLHFPVKYNHEVRIKARARPIIFY